MGAPQSAPVQIAAADSSDFGLGVWESFLVAGVALPLLLMVGTFMRRCGPVGSHA